MFNLCQTCFGKFRNKISWPTTTNAFEELKDIPTAHFCYSELLLPTNTLRSGLGLFTSLKSKQVYISLLSVINSIRRFTTIYKQSLEKHDHATCVLENCIILRFIHGTIFLLLIHPWISTDWGRVTHKCVVKLTINGSDNGLSPGRHQAIIWTNAGILLIGTLGTNFSEILIGIPTFSFKKMHSNISSAKWRLFCLGLNVL